MNCIENEASISSSIAGCICCHGNCLLSHCLAAIGGYTYRHRLMGGIYEIHYWDELKCHDIHTDLHKDWFRHSKVGGGIYIQTHRQEGDLINVLLFFQSRLKSGLWKSWTFGIELKKKNLDLIWMFIFESQTLRVFRKLLLLCAAPHELFNPSEP
jgi:hypothetical protein